VFTRDLDLPGGRERRPVRDRDRVYEIDGTESRMLGTIGAFRAQNPGASHTSLCGPSALHRFKDVR
jgi:hypothetical protein